MMDERKRRGAWARGRRPLALALGLAVLSGLILDAACQRPMRVQAHHPPGSGSRKPVNLLLIVADDLSGLWLGAAGDPRRATPHIDALAREGVYFERAFCNSPLCTPSRQSFITGLLPHAVGVTRLETPLPERALTLGHWLGVLGYRTAAIGKMHFQGSSHHGFDVRIDTPDWEAHLKTHPPAGGDHRRPWRPFVDPPTDWLNARCRDDGLPAASSESTYFVDRAIEFLDRSRDAPFALVVSFNEPHAPFRFPREWLGRYRPRDFTAPVLSPAEREQQPKVFRDLAPEDYQGVQAAYFTSLSFLDTQVGRLLRALDERGLGQDTLVVLLGDNGYMLGRRGRFEKNCFDEPAVRVPLIVRRKGRLPGGRRVRDLVELVDLFPTVCSLLNVPAPPVLHGIDLAPLIRGAPGAKGRASAFSAYHENEEAMIRTDRYKLIVGTGRRRRKDHMEPARPPTAPYLRLYDLERDPDEARDLGADPAHAALIARLLGEMRRRFEATWAGPEAIPPGLPDLETIHWCLRPRD